MKLFRYLVVTVAMALGLNRAVAEDNVRADGKPAFKTVDLKEFEKMRQGTNVVVLDVRTQREFDQGHIPNAVLLNVNGATFEQDASKLDRSKTYLVHCAAGIRSMKACNIMRTLDFTNLYNLKGGYNAWADAGNKPTK